MPVSLRLFLLFCFAPLSDALAQEFEVRGKVSASGKPAGDLIVTLLNAGDSSVRRSVMTDSAGEYLLQHITSGNYLVTVQTPGFREAWLPVQVPGTTVLPELALVKADMQLKEVSVTERKRFVEQKPDRTVVNVDAMISASGSTALDVLEKSPGVLVDQNGGISMKGRGNVTVYIDDKPTNLSGNDLADYLRALPSSTIAQVELMTNPPARYDAAGTGGIINLRTKRIRTKGFNGLLNLAYGQGRRTRTNNSLNLNYRHNKINVYALLGYNLGGGFNDLDIDRTFYTDQGVVRSYLKQNSGIVFRSHNFSAKAGVDFYATDRTTFGMVLTGVSRNGRTDNNNRGDLLNAAAAADSSVIAINEQHNLFTNGGINLYGRHNLKKGASFAADLDYLVYNTRDRQQFNNSTYLPDHTLTTSDQLNGYLPAQIRIYAAKADYSQPFAHDLKLDAGVKIAYTKTDNIADYTRTAYGVTSPDYDKSNHFLYNETISAAYLNGSKTFGRLSMQAGLRLEHTASDGFQTGNVLKPDSAFTRRYTDLFPTAYLSYKLDTAGNHTLNLNYGKRISRPYFQDLNPFLSPLDKFTYYTGNPFLRPSYTHSLELTYSYKEFLTLGIGFHKEKDNSDETVEMIRDVYYNKPGNIANVDIGTLSVNVNYPLLKRLTVNVYAELSHTHSYSDFYTGRLDTRGTAWYLQPMIQYNIGKGWMAQADGNYSSDRVFSQFVSLSRWRANLSVSKKLSKAATVRLIANDLFYSNINSGNITNLYQATAYYNNRFDSRNVVLTFSWNFGKTMSDHRRHELNSAEEEKNRVKN